jgi:hypothetical protein
MGMKIITASRNCRPKAIFAHNFNSLAYRTCPQCMVHFILYSVGGNVETGRIVYLYESCIFTYIR